MIPSANSGKSEPYSDLTKFVQPEGAATEIEDVIICRHVGLQSVVNRMYPMLASFFNLQQSCFTHDAEMLGDIVLRDLETVGNFIHTKFVLEKQAKDLQSSFLA